MEALPPRFQSFTQRIRFCASPFVYSIDRLPPSGFDVTKILRFSFFSVPGKHGCGTRGIVVASETLNPVRKYILRFKTHPITIKQYPRARRCRRGRGRGMYNLHFHGSTYARVIHLQGGLHFDSAIGIVKNAISNGLSGALLSFVLRAKYQKFVHRSDIFETTFLTRFYWLVKSFQ